MDPSLSYVSLLRTHRWFTMSKFGDIRSILQHAPTPSIWANLRASLARYEGARDEVAPYCEDIVSSWPELLRLRLPEGWRDQLKRRGEDLSPLLSPLQAARRIVRQTPLSSSILGEGGGVRYWDGVFFRSAEEITADILAASLNVHMGTPKRRLQDGAIGSEPAGFTQMGGVPLYPPGFEPPSQHIFVAQLDLTALSSLDPSERLPEHGMLYIFFDEEMDCTLVHLEGDTRQIDLIPAEVGSPHSSEVLWADPFYTFHSGSSESSERLDEAIASEWGERLDILLGCRMRSDSRHAEIYPVPYWWQGEADYFEMEGIVYNDLEPGVTLLQTEYGEATLHFWVDEDEARRGDFSGAWVTGSGT